MNTAKKNKISIMGLMLESAFFLYSLSLAYHIFKININLGIIYTSIIGALFSSYLIMKYKLEPLMKETQAFIDEQNNNKVYEAVIVEDEGEFK